MSVITTKSFTAGGVTITKGSGSPTSIPKKHGDMYIDVTNDYVYVATDILNSSNWIIVSNAGAGGVYNQAEKNALELEMGFKNANGSNYKELGYDTTSGDLSSINIYTTSAKTTQLFSKTLGYNSNGNLIQVSTTRSSDNKNLTKNISYNIYGDLFSIEAILI